MQQLAAIELCLVPRTSGPPLDDSANHLRLVKSTKLSSSYDIKAEVGNDETALGSISLTSQGLRIEGYFDTFKLVSEGGPYLDNIQDDNTDEIIVPSSKLDLARSTNLSFHLAAPADSTSIQVNSSDPHRDSISTPSKATHRWLDRDQTETSLLLQEDLDRGRNSSWASKADWTPRAKKAVVKDTPTTKTRFRDSEVGTGDETEDSNDDTPHDGNHAEAGSNRDYEVQVNGQEPILEFPLYEAKEDVYDVPEDPKEEGVAHHRSNCFTAQTVTRSAPPDFRDKREEAPAAPTSTGPDQYLTPAEIPTVVTEDPVHKLSQDALEYGPAIERNDSYMPDVQHADSKPSAIFGGDTKLTSTQRGRKRKAIDDVKPSKMESSDNAQQTPQAKRTRTDDAGIADDAPASSTRSSTRATTTPASVGAIEANEPRVLIFSNTDVLDGPTERFLKKQKVKVTEKEEQSFDVLVVGKGALKRTPKLLMAVARGRAIVTDQWIVKSVQAGYMVSMDGYGITDNKTAKQWGLDYEDPKARTDMLANKHVQVTPAAKKEWGSEGFKSMSSLAKTMGAASFVGKKPSKNEKNDEKVYIVNEKGDPDAGTLIEQGIQCYTTELIPVAVLRGNIDWDSPEFAIGTEEEEPLPKSSKKKGKR